MSEGIAIGGPWGPLVVALLALVISILTVVILRGDDR